MLANIQKLEDTQAVCLQENDQIDITTKKRRAVKSLAERFEGYTGSYRCFEADTGGTVGSEVTKNQLPKICLTRP